VNPVAQLRVFDASATARAAQAPPVAHLHRHLPGPAPERGTPAEAAAGKASPTGPAPASWTTPLADIERARVRLDGMLAEARRGRTFSPQELLCLQADAHRFAQSVELTARAVEHGVQGLRQAVQSQV
jgi:hypothetical protein